MKHLCITVKHELGEAIWTHGAVIVAYCRASEANWDHDGTACLELNTAFHFSDQGEYIIITLLKQETTSGAKKGSMYTCFN